MVKPQLFDVKKPLAFKDAYLDAIFSNMLLKTRFSVHAIHSIFEEIRAALKPKGLVYFAVRNHKTNSMVTGLKLKYKNKKNKKKAFMTYMVFR